MSGDLNLPYEPVEGAPIQIDTDGHLCGGVVVRAAVAESPLGKIPMLVFTFADASGRGFLPPIMLAIEDAATATGIVTLVRDATMAAMQAARP